MDQVTRQEALAGLPERQRECLRLVYRHHNSKEIARALGLSEHTVDGHLRKAIGRLGVATRIEAARLLAAHEGDAQPLSAPQREHALAAAGTHPQPLSAQPSSVDLMPPPVDQGHADRASGLIREERLPFGAFAEEDGYRARRPIFGGNRMSALQTVALIAVVLAAVTVVLSSAYPIGEGVQHLANLLQPAHY